ncbi:hypothetical protein AIOL_003110 [Candidatus Rhodobacter oscarellae]|uniref:Uncharacterized protein n=1 Tax=Candidatus Rhodobacter oscarellae TaxID=1675527 RepID=A0A0J9E902_9RHOB|nr:ankyrin repeat domain-containing protein [Candidatus Rhodobacter lobularis]KMW58139.1 hypothetical protein AIOL_003110 [Candidatus Rhodobacter lobularis]
MDAQEYLIRMAAAVMNGDNAEMRKLVDEAEEFIAALPESQAETATMLQTQLASLRGMIALNDAAPDGPDALQAELEAAMEAGDDAKVAEISARISAGADEMMAQFEAVYPPGPPLPPEVEDLFDALEQGDVALARAALQHTDVNGRFGEYEKTPLYHALSATDPREPEMVQMLLAAGADPRVGLSDNNTPLHAIADHMGPPEDVAQLSEVVRLLVAAGADIEARTDSYGWTPLQRAVMEGDAVELEALLRNGADPQALYAEHSMPAFSPGRTMLQIAGSSLDKVRLLLDYGADPQQRDAYGQSCADYLRGSIAEPPDRFAEILGGSDAEYKAGLSAALALVEAAPRKQ